MQLELKWHLSICQLLIEPLILILSDLSLIFVPDGRHFVYLLPVQSDWVVYELRELGNNLINFILLAKFTAVRLQFHDYLGAALKIEVFGSRHREITRTIRDPCDAFRLTVLFGEYLNSVSHYETGIEANTELPNNRRKCILTGSSILTASVQRLLIQLIHKFL